MTEAPRPRAGLDAGEETVMNMTPMIDIVFQLIIFFLLSLKFKTVDERIDAQLPPVGLAPIAAPLDTSPKIKLKLIRREKGSDTAYTLLKVDNSHQLRLPAGPWASDAHGEAERLAAYERVRAKLISIVDAKWTATGRDPETRAEIVTPRPHGGSVPHGDSIFALDTLVAAGLTNVQFEGAPMP